MTTKEMHIMRIKEQEARRGIKKRPTTPLAKEIEMRRETIIRGIIGESVNIVNKQLEVASLLVSNDGKNNDVIIKATNSLLDRAFGKPKESIDLTGNVQFSLRELSKRADALEIEATVIDD